MCATQISTEKAAQEESDAFLKTAARVERLKFEEGTRLTQDVESAPGASTETRDTRCARGRKFEKNRAAAEEARELATRLAGGAQRGEQMRREVAAFVGGLATEALVVGRPCDSVGPSCDCSGSFSCVGSAQRGRRARRRPS